MENPKIFLLNYKNWNVNVVSKWVIKKKPDTPDKIMAVSYQYKKQYDKLLQANFFWKSILFLHSVLQITL